MTRRTLPDPPAVDVHLQWLRRAIADPQVNTRLVLEGILDVLEARTELLAELVADQKGGPR
jgi:hypothetical protein